MLLYTATTWAGSAKFRHALPSACLNPTHLLENQEMSCSFLYLHLGPPTWITRSDSYIYLEPHGYLGYDFVRPRERDSKGSPGQVSALTQDPCSLPFRQHPRARILQEPLPTRPLKVCKAQERKIRSCSERGLGDSCRVVWPGLLLGSAPISLL